MASPTHYEVLGVASSASVEEIRSAYRTAARRRHPDSGGSVDAMQRLNEAWHVLGDPGRRAVYDRSLTQATGLIDAPRAARTAPPGRRPAGAAADDADWSEMEPDGLDPDDLFGDPNPFEPGPSAAGVEGWWAMLPPGVLVLAVALFFGAFLFTSPALLVFSGGALFVSVGLFVLVPMRSMLQSSQRRDRPDVG